MAEETKDNVVPIPTRIVHVWHEKVISTQKIIKDINFRRKAGAEKPNENAPVNPQDVEYDTIVIGYSVRTSESSALMFPEDPGYKEGDVLTHTITKEPHLNVK